MIKTIIFDFDGVILDSMKIRLEGFRQIFKGASEEVFEAFIPYHLNNGGISRFVKIRHFYENMLHQTITEEEVMHLAEHFSEIMVGELSNPKYLITDTVLFISENHQKYNMHIASGAEHKELLYLCQSLALENFFKSIHGSPQPKHEILKDIMTDNDYRVDATIMIGDSIRDYEAADMNQIPFYGFNNSDLAGVGMGYIENFSDWSC